MRVPRLFTHSALQVGAEIQLEEASSHYINRVLRMESGRPLVLFNGTGGEYTATVSQQSKKYTSVIVDGFSDINRESSLSIHLGIGVSKGDRFEWVLQKATELGVSKITPILTDRTEFKLKPDRQAKKYSHWQQIIISACEQSQRNLLPQLQPIIEFSDWLPTLSESHKFVLHHRSNEKLASVDSPLNIALAVGPEGGLSSSEIQQAEASGFSALTLGPRVLRTETAPLAAISLMQYLWGDFS
jgi:16S rRNA (uracil1498-N3)-methyltransferase